jgi:hypothetical protein
MPMSHEEAFLTDIRANRISKAMKEKLRKRFGNRVEV